MSGYLMATLTCDDCGEIFDDGQAFTITEARAAARRYGWRQPARGRDLCRRCANAAA